MRNFLLSISRDVLCGKLACVWPHKNTYKNDVQSAVYSYIQGHECLSVTTGSLVRLDGRDHAYVADGTICGTQMVTKHVHLYLAMLNSVILSDMYFTMTITITLSGFEPGAAAYFPYDIKKIN